MNSAESVPDLITPLVRQALQIAAQRFAATAASAGEIRSVEVDEAVAVLVLLAALRGPKARTAAFALADLLAERRGLERACESLFAWS